MCALGVKAEQSGRGAKGVAVLCSDVRAGHQAFTLLWCMVPERAFTALFLCSTNRA